MPIETYSFNSTNIDSAEFDPDSKTLTITFLRGGEYSFYNVPPEVWEQFKFAPSAGRFFAQSIKNRY